MSSSAAFGYHARFCEAANQYGFDGVTLNHHYLSGPDAQCFQPLVTAGYVMARFPSLYVMVSVFLLPYHNPVEVAEQVATLDQMAPNRLLFGVGQGYRAVEAAALGIAPDSRRQRMVEGIAALRLLWSQPKATFHGEYVRFEEADIGVRPANGSGPPILVAADKLRTIATVLEAGADHWLPSPRHSESFLREALPVYKRALHSAGRMFTGIALQRDVCVADTEATAEAMVRESFVALMKMQHRWGQPGERYDLEFNELKKNRMILGTPDHVANEIVRLHDEFGVEYLTLRVYTPGMDPEQAMDVAQRLGEDVLPKVRNALGTNSLFLVPTATTPHLT
jgi:alkanesulfonate monooxygenase SsuD/methylene tetrahydromethanopterin reductase-like flavin-dependent oxidoreductase (luciferase family)